MEDKEKGKNYSKNNDGNFPQKNQRGKNESSDLSNLAFGKVPPQSIPLEEAVLGAIMTTKDSLSIVLDILRPETFYLEANQHIYRSMLRLFEKSQPIDLLTLTEDLKKTAVLDKVGGTYYLVDLTNRVASAANIEFHARILAQKHIQRELIRASTTIVRDAFEDTTDVFDLLDKAESELFAIAQNNLSRGAETMSSLSAKVLKSLEELSKKEDGLTGVPTGFVDLDRITSGWQPSDLIIVAARPGMGKTSFTLALARNAAVDFKKPVAMFSLEMSNIQFAQRLISMEAEISGSKLRTGKLESHEWHQLHAAVEKLSEIPIFIDDTPGINVFELRAKCRRLKMQHDIQMIIIDYLQLMSGTGAEGKGSNREQEISTISRALKGLAKELSVPVIALSQLSRAVETRGGTKRPQLSDLRECVTGDTKIFLADGTMTTIQSLVGQKAEVLSFSNDKQKLTTQTSELIWAVGKKAVYQVKLASGRQIKCSFNHRLLSEKGWTEINALTVNQLIATLNPIDKNSKDVFWDKITSIEYIGEEEVFDLSVPETNAWIANGIISHNSGAIEQDADIVSFIYRPEYYGIKEDEEGASLVGVAEIIIAKHRNGALDTVKLKFTDQYAKFSNLDDPLFDSVDTAAFKADPYQDAQTMRFQSKMNTDSKAGLGNKTKFIDDDVPF